MVRDHPRVASGSLEPFRYRTKIGNRREITTSQDADLWMTLLPTAVSVVPLPSPIPTPLLSPQPAVSFGCPPPLGQGSHLNRNDL